MSTAEDFHLVLRRNERAMNRQRREFAEHAVDAMTATQRPGATVFDAQAYLRASVALRPLYDEFYGAFPGDRRARFWQLIVGECRDARSLVFARAVQDVRRRLRSEPALIRAVREAA